MQIFFVLLQRVKEYTFFWNVAFILAAFRGLISLKWKGSTAFVLHENSEIYSSIRTFLLFSFQWIN
jgi:hypothetical protein